jgi:gentisate 1,2-dioxygenase
MDEGAYLHVASEEPVMQVVGLVKEEMANSNVLGLF